MADDDTESTDKAEPKKETSRLGRFIQTYHSFLSSFVIGAAGLIATSIWQYRQAEVARHQAESQQKIAETQAENSWRIERAEILSKNLQVLAASGSSNVEQRYGVLLSLTRGNILDPELAVSYALELGKDNPDYMKSVLANTVDKSYARLASAFELSCSQRFGVARDVPLCKADKQAERSGAIAELVADELEAARSQGRPGPAVLLADERQVQSTPARLAWLFQPFLVGLYERRQWAEIQRFEANSVGAQLVTALVLGPQRPTEFVAASEAPDVDKFHEEHVKWLMTYLFGAGCGGECKGKLVDVLLTSFAESQGRFDDGLRQLLKRPRAEVAAALSRLHTRLLACQVSDDDVAALRDRVLLPALADEAGRAKPDQARLDDLLGLVALVPEPKAPAKGDDAAAAAPRKAWAAALGKVHDTMRDRFNRAYAARRAAAQVARKAPPPALRKAMFCRAAESPDDEIDLGED